MLHKFLRRYWGAAFFVLIYLPVGAQADVFAVTGIKVDARAEDGVAAKAMALAEAQRKALQQLLRRLSLRADYDRLPETAAKDITPLLRDFSVESEKFGGGRYLASFTIRFKPEGIRVLFRTAGVPFAETASRPIMILPVYKKLGSTLLWDDPNPWLQAWSQIKLPDGLLSLILPVGDLSDVTKISAEQAENGNEEKLQAFADKYNASGVVVVVGNWQRQPLSDRQTLGIVQTAFGAGIGQQTGLRQFESNAERSEQDFLRESAVKIARDLDENWKSVNLLSGDIKQSLSVSAAISSFPHWLAIRRKLEAVASLRQVSLNSISTRNAVMTLDFVGNASQFKVALAQQDLDLVFSDGEWQLHLRENR